MTEPLGRSPADRAGDRITPRYEFGSAAWLAMVHATFRARLQVALDGRCDRFDFSLSEAFTDPPPHVARGRALVGWTCEFHDGIFSFRGEPDGKAAYRVTGRYDGMIELVRYRIGDDAERRARYAAMGAELYHAGDVRIGGEAQVLPRAFDAVHDIVAGFTA